MLDVAAACLLITALLAWVNHRFIGLPTTIGVMATALAFSLAVVGLDALGFAESLRVQEEALLQRIDFTEVLMEGMLSLLLFAGALHVDVVELRAVRWQVLSLALVGTVASTVVVGLLTWKLLPMVGVALPLAWCLLFGALISPTDPIAVLGILRSAGAPRHVELVITGESLFNDGVGVVLFALLLGVVHSGETPGAREAALLLAREAGGGLAFGALIGGLGILVMRTVDDYRVEVLITLALAFGGYALARHLHVSGPLAAVVAGLLVGNPGRRFAMSEKTQHHVDMFWELLDEILNMVLFVLIGMEVVAVRLDATTLVAGVLAVLVALFARWLTVGLPAQLLHPILRTPAGAWRILTWGGLRGGISVALALALPAGEARDAIVAMTYCVVVFSILVQGLTIGRVVRRAAG